MSCLARRRVESEGGSPTAVHALARPLTAVALCLAIAGCGTISIGVSNSPDWCPGGKDSKACP